MRIIEKNGALVRTLTAAEQALVEDFEQGLADGPRGLQANRWLLKVRAQGQWLACDCQPNTLPVMNVTLNGNTGTLFLKNNPGTPDHALDCPMRKNERTQRELGDTSAEPALAWLPPDMALKLVGEYRTGAAEPGSGSAPGPSRREQQRLLSLLLTLIEASGLNVYATDLKKDLARQFAELRGVATRYPLIERVPASNYLETRIDMKHMMMLKSRLKDATVFAAQRRHGLLLDCVSEVRGRKVIGERNSVGFDFQGHHWLWGGAKSSGPLLALAIYSPATAGSQFYQMIHVATVPVLSKGHLFPVFRDEEREPLKMLVSLIDWMAGKGVRVVMRRPVIGARVMDELVLSSDLDRVLSVSLVEQPAGPEPSSDTFKRLADFKSLETFRKYVAGFFMRDRG